MGSQEVISHTEGAAFPWILEHLLTYPGTYEIPLRTMYTLNVSTQNQYQTSHPIYPTSVPGNAFPPRAQTPSLDEHRNMTTAAVAAQLRANLISHISQLPSQPTSLPPSFITTFVRRCFPAELEQVDFPNALTVLDYLKDLEVRRRREVVAALDRLGIERNDIGNKDKLARKYPGVVKWVMDIEDKERKIEALYTQVYIGLRRWTLINELSLIPFNKANCIAMLNTLYPPTVSINPSQIVQPTAQLTPQILASQRNGFFRYITAVEKKGPNVLSSLMEQHKRPGETTGWPCLQETVDNYLGMANSIIDECYEVMGDIHTYTATESSTSANLVGSGHRKVESGISFGSNNSSNRSSGQSNTTAATSASGHSDHSRKLTKQKKPHDKPQSFPLGDEGESTPKPAGSTLERIARELRRMKSKHNVKEGRQSSNTPAASPERSGFDNGEESTLSTPTRGRTVRLKRSLMRMRSTGRLRENSLSRPLTEGDEQIYKGVPNFAASDMQQQLQNWEERRKMKLTSDKMEIDE